MLFHIRTIKNDLFLIHRFFQEHDGGEYSPLFAKHFISEGINHEHTIVCIGRRTADWMKTLPSPVEGDGKCSSKLKMHWLFLFLKQCFVSDANEQTKENDDDLRIAWRYKRRQIHTRFSHSYDLSKHRPESQLENCHIVDELENLDTVIHQISDICSRNQSNVVRIVLDAVGMPITDDCIVTRFFHKLKCLISSPNTVILTLYPPQCISEFLNFYLEDFFNYVLTVKTLSNDKNPVYKDYHGILTIDKVGTMNTFTMPLYDLTDRFFKVKRKKFIIEKMHLPPDLSETVSRSATNNSNVTASNLDF